MPWISGRKPTSRGVRHGGSALGIVFARDKAGGKPGYGQQRYTVRCRLGSDVLDKCRLKAGDYLDVEFDPEQRRLRIVRLTESERREEKRGWKLLPTSSNKETRGGACYFKGTMAEKWESVLFPNGNDTYVPADYRIEDGCLVCDWPARETK